VFFCVGCEFLPTFLYRNFDYRSVHVTAAQSIAKVAAQNGISKLVHVSHLNASLGSISRFYQTKAEGELAVKEAFSDATIIRPSIMFGYEDKLLNSMAGLSNVCHRCGMYAEHL
jgi:NADH dehydrogenase (ubiquinone) 1 alpha subcomplex subunit 9